MIPIITDGTMAKVDVANAIAPRSQDAARSPKVIPE
jgi:hypothetical protein